MSKSDDKWAIFDMDDVVVDFCSFIVPHMYDEQDRGQMNDVKIENLIETYTFDRLFENQDVFYNFLEKIKVIEEVKLHDDALSVIQSFKDEGFKIGILTARGWHSNGYNLTKEFLQKNNVAFDKLVLTRHHHESKGAYLHEFDGQSYCFIDDSARHVESMINMGAVAFLQNRPWNKSANIQRVDSLSNFRDVVFKIFDIKNNIENRLVI